jgi:hypothetical protein
MENPMSLFRNSTLIAGIGAVALLGMPAIAHADTTITTGPPSTIYGITGPPSTIYGISSLYNFAETFTAPVGASDLQNYTVYAEDTGKNDTFKTEIVAWGSKGEPVGPLLFTSPVETITSSFKDLPFTTDITGGLALTGGDTYAILTNTDGLNEPDLELLGANKNNASDTTNGFTYNGSFTRTPRNQQYFDITGVGYQQAVSLDFSAAPEPSQIGMLALMGLGLGGLMLRARRKATLAA